MTAALAAGCRDYTGPSGPREVYALARVGPDRLPVPLFNDRPLPLLVADTFRLVRSRSDLQILQQTTVTADGPGGKTRRSETQFIYRIENGRLVYDGCPIDAFCIANLIAAPRVFQIAGDSLFEVVPVEANTAPHVYGLVRYFQ